MDVQTTRSNKKSNVNVKIADAEVQIRQLIEDFHEAVRAGDVDKIMSFYAPTVVAFDMMPPLQFVGKEAYRKSWETGLQMMNGGSMEFSAHDLRITANDDVGFSHCLSRATGSMKDGKNLDMWVRWTGGFCKIDDQWLITHEQISVPIDMESGKALFNLKPEQSTTEQ